MRLWSDSPAISESFAKLLAPLQHTLDRCIGLKADVFGHLDLGRHVAKAVAQLFDSIHFHITAIVARTSIRGAGNESLVWDLALEAMDHPSLCHDDDFLGFTILAETDHLFGAADLIRIIANSFSALWMSDDEGVGEL